MLKNISIIGLPNSGKTTLFNTLTKKKAKTGNYSGVTVSENTATIKYKDDTITFCDLPGFFSLYVNSQDEFISLKHILNNNYDFLILVTSVNGLKNSIKILLQLKKLNIPTILAINKNKKDANTIDSKILSERLSVKILYKDVRNITFDDILSLNIPKTYRVNEEYLLWLKVSQKKDFLLENPKNNLTDFNKEKIKETILLSKDIDNIFKNYTIINKIEKSNFENKIDKILIHKTFGLIIFFLILFVSFHFIFKISNFFSNYIDILFSNIINFSRNILDSFKINNLISDIISEGILPALSGVIIFIPQIFILFLFIRFLEESGYMTRIVFLLDKFMKSLGLSSKSVIPYISGTTCAVPSILSCRTIENKIQKFITILTVPFTTCSARVPIYIIIISLVIPNKNIFGFINLQSLTLFSLYILGFFIAIISALILKYTLKNEIEAYNNKFLIEFPNYQLISPKELIVYSYEKSKEFFLGIAKIITIISIFLWILSSYNFSKNNIVKTDLEHSFMGTLGKSIEPVIEPLGYDWKIGISLISSIAAREAFIGSLASIYGIDENNYSLLNKMKNEINPKTKEKTFNLATGLSILIFYAFALQCISTLATTKSELGGWKYPIYQFIIMNSFAYLSAMLVYNIFK